MSRRSFSAAVGSPTSLRVYKADHDEVARLERVSRVSPEQKRLKIINNSRDHFKAESRLWQTAGSEVQLHFHYV